jgi:hypothetical protein
MTSNYHIKGEKRIRRDNAVQERRAFERWLRETARLGVIARDRHEPVAPAQHAAMGEMKVRAARVLL